MRSAFKNYGAAFLVALLIFGVIGYFAVRTVAGTVESILKNEKEDLDSIISDTENTSDGTNGEISDDSGDVKINGESFNFLLAATDYMPGVYEDYILSPDDALAYSSLQPAYTVGILNGAYRVPHLSSLVLVRADKENRAFVYLYLSPSMRVSTTAGNLSLSEIYYKFGMERLKEHIYALTGLSVDYSFLISGYNFDGFTGVAGTVLVNNPKDVYSDGMYNTYAASTLKTILDENGQEVTVTVANEHLLYSGELEMTAQRLYTALSVIEHSKADLGTKQTVATAIAEGYVKGFASISQSRISDALTNLISTKGVLVSDFDVNELGSLYELFSHANDFQTVKLSYPCSYRAETDSIAEYFKPDLDKGLELLSQYRNPER